MSFKIIFALVVKHNSLISAECFKTKQILDILSWYCKSLHIVRLNTMFNVYRIDKCFETNNYKLFFNFLNNIKSQISKTAKFVCKWSC